MQVMEGLGARETRIARRKARPEASDLGDVTAGSDGREG